MPSCPNCNHKLLEIIYGMPSEEILEEAKEGKVFLAGCVINDNHLKYHCNNCQRSYSKNLKTFEIQKNNWDNKPYFKTNKISKLEFEQLKEDNLIFITNPGRMGDEDCLTFIIKDDNELKIYQVDGLMYNKNSNISLNDIRKMFPKWNESWKHSKEKNYKGKYTYLYMGFGNGLSIDNSIYNEFKPYLNKLISEYLKQYNDDNIEYQYVAVYNVWKDAFIKMIIDKGYIIK